MRKAYRRSFVRNRGMGTRLPVDSVLALALGTHRSRMGGSEYVKESVKARVWTVSKYKTNPETENIEDKDDRTSLLIEFVIKCITFQIKEPPVNVRLTFFFWSQDAFSSVNPPTMNDLSLACHTDHRSQYRADRKPRSQYRMIRRISTQALFTYIDFPNIYDQLEIIQRWFELLSDCLSSCC